jgi:membrane protease YdiL (CAAX protease family)
MPTLLLFIFYLVTAMLLAALLFYPVFEILHVFWDVRPERVFHRLFMIIAILGFWPLLKLSGLNNRYALGYSAHGSRFIQALIKGLGIGVLIMTVHAILLLLLGARVPKPDAILFTELLYNLFTGLMAGIVVALIEESFFRGALQSGMRRSSSFITTSVCVALFYAAVHFIKPYPLPAEIMIDWSSGWHMLISSFNSFINFSGIADSYIALFAAGMLLSLVRETSGNIALCIGIHAGWVWAIKMTKEVTNLDPAAPTAFLIGSYDNIIGWAATVVLSVAILLYWRLLAIKTANSTL